MQTNHNFPDCEFTDSGSNPFTGSKDVREYFDSLPEYIRENIMQSGIEIKSVEHLKELEKNFADD